MNDKDLLQELDDIVSKLKMRIIFYQTENKELKTRIEELKKYVKEK
jgi:chaperonin cofactor prefoldin